MADVFRQEVLDLHSYLERWLKGMVPQGDGRPTRFAEALSDDFVVVHPDGTLGTKTEVLDAFAAAYGEKPAGYALEVGPIRTRLISPGVCLAIYQERHRGEAGRERVSSAILRQHPEGRAIEWLFLQETLAPHLASEPPGNG